MASFVKYGCEVAICTICGVVYFCSLAASVAFKKLDVDNSGFLEKEELIPVVKKWAETCNAEIGLDASAHLDAMIAATDANSDGKIDLLEFVPIFQKCIQDAGIWN